MNVKIAIQDSYIREDHTAKLVEACKKVGVDYECFGLVPFVENVSAIRGDITQDTESFIIPFGSTKIIKLWLRNQLPENWKIFYNSIGFDFRNQLQFVDRKLKLRNHLLNSENSHFLHFPECADLKFQQDKFIKPTDDLKLFNGQILPRYTSLRELLSQQNTDSNIYDRNEAVIISDVVEIEKEWRCFVVDDELASISLYKENGKPNVKLQLYDFDVYDMYDLISLYNPTRSGSPYVVDICRIKDKSGLDNYRIVEYNAFQCSGFYACNVEKILRKLVDSIYYNYGT